MIPRTDETWLQDLTGEPRHQEAALCDLREALLRGLRKALAGRPGVDDAFLQDATQDALIRILDRLSQFAGHSRFLTWATSIVIRAGLSELRRRRWKDVSLDDVLNDGELVVDRATDPSDVSQSDDRHAIVETMYSVIDRELTDRQRKALIAELHGMPLGEIARHLGSNRNAIYKLTHDARKRLQRGMEAAGVRVEHIRATFFTATGR